MTECHQRSFGFSVCKRCKVEASFCGGAVVHGRRDTSSNLRYKYGDNLKADPKEAVFIGDPKTYRLPRFSMGTTWLLAKEDYFFVYPTNFNEYQRKFAGTFQHGGISLPEMVLPVVTMRPK